MINLIPGIKLQVALSGAITTNQCPFTIGYRMGPGLGRQEILTKHGITASATQVDVLLGGEQLHVENFSLYNADTAQITATLRLNDDGTSGNGAVATRIITVITLQTLETLVFSESRGFYVLDVNGQQKTNIAAASSTVSTADSKGVSAGLAASVVQSNLTSIDTAEDLIVSTADSKGVSAGLAASVATSAATSQNTAASTATSTALSTATSAGLAASVATSSSLSNDTQQSTSISTINSKITSGNI